MWGWFRHYKGMDYLTLGKALHSESLEAHTAYLALYTNSRGAHWVRPESMFSDQAGPGGTPRFQRMGTVRRLALEDTKDFFLFGKDAWGPNLSLEEHAHQYDSCPNFLRGDKFILENEEGIPVAGVNLIRFLPQFSGIATLATHPDYRRQGYAGVLLRAVMALSLQERSDLRFGLFAEINPKYFEKWGFAPLPTESQKFSPSIAMATGSSKLSPREELIFKSYF
jgi:GNAT superfamily N-acetyltransferase